MKKGLYIKRNLGPLLLPLGFVYEADSGIWLYERTIDGPHGMKYPQSIYIQRHRFADELFLRMDNSIPEQPSSLDVNKIIPGETRYAVGFEGDEGFKQVVDYFVQAVQQYLLPRLDELSKIIVQDPPSPDDQRYVYENHEELAARFCQRVGVDYTMSPVEWLQRAYDVIMELKGQSYTQAKEDLMELASCLGMWIQTNREGKWVFTSANTVVLESFTDGSHPVLHTVANTLRDTNRCSNPEEIREIVFQLIWRK